MPSINSFSAERAGDAQILPGFQIPRGQGLQLRSLESAGIDPAIQAYEGVLNRPVTIQVFEGMNNVNGLLPPDPIGAAGLNHYVQMINTSFAVWDKSGTLLYGPVNISTLFNGLGGVCETEDRGDPVVLYDHLANRWLMSVFSFADTGSPDFDPVGPYHQCIAISETSDPLGSWYRYDFIVSNTKINDYPKFGVWPDGYYLAVNQFEQPTFSWSGQGVAVFERDKMLVGESAQMVYFDMFGVDATLGAMLPSDLDGPAPPANTPNFYMQFDDDAWGYSDDQLQIWEFSVDWDIPANSSFTKLGELSTFAFDSNMCNYQRDCIPQADTSQGVDAISDRLMYRLQYRNFGSYEAMVVNHTVDVGSDRAGIRWYELRDTGAGWTIYQQGSYSPSSTHRWMGSIAMDSAGNIALGHSASNTTWHPAIHVASREAGDPLGTLPQQYIEIAPGQSSGGSQTHSSGRWGDYSMMTIDPVDDCTFWYTNEYYETTSSFSFETRIGSFKLSDCSSDPAWKNLGDNGSGNGVFGDPVQVIAIDSNDQVFAGGDFDNLAGIATADNIAMWDGSNWQALGSNGSGNGAISGWVNSIIVDAADNIYVGGYFGDAGGNLEADFLAVWDGFSWNAVGNTGAGIGAFNQLVFDIAIDSAGNIYAAGRFTNAGGDPTADYVAKWDGFSWTGLGSDGAGDGAIKSEVWSLAVDSSDNLYIGGTFTDVADIPEADAIAMWDGLAWNNLGNNGAGNGPLVGDGGAVRDLAVDSSDNLLVGGDFESAGGNTQAFKIAIWDGLNWSNIGNGASGSTENNTVFSIALDLDGNIFIGGLFQNLGGDPEVDHIAVWDGASWRSFGNYGEGAGAITSQVYTIAFDGTGDLYAGGAFTDAAGNLKADRIARYPLSALTFFDVQPDHPQFSYIESLWDAGFTAGCTADPLLFCPDTILDRAQSAVFILRGQLGTGYTPPDAPWDTFQDDWSLSDISWAEKWAEGMWDEGLTAGCISSPLQYCPRNTLPRVEAAVFGLRLLHGSSYVPPDPTGALFADMTDTDYWGLKWAEQAYLDGLLPACGFTSSQPLFCPLDDVSRAWAAYMIVIAKSLPLP